MELVIKKHMRTYVKVVGVLGACILSYLLYVTYRDPVDEYFYGPMKNQVLRTELNMKSMCLQIQALYRANQRLPDSTLVFSELSKLVQSGTYIQEKVRWPQDDGWGQPIIYRVLQSSEGPIFSLMSVGSNGLNENGSGDDIIGIFNADDLSKVNPTTGEEEGSGSFSDG